MHPFPSTPRLAEAPAALFETGHLWLLEHLVGDLLRFRPRPAGGLQFGDRSRRFDGEIPTPYGVTVSTPLRMW